MGHCSCCSEIESVETALARECLAKSERQGTVIPSNITSGTFIQFAADNNDINEETLDEKNTTHATTLVFYQQKPFGPMSPKEVLTKSTAHQNSLACVGQSLNIHEDIVEKIEAFFRSLYLISAKGPKTVDEARYVMFCQTSKSNMVHPPTSDSLLQHTKRANYQAYVWKKALVATQRLPSPDDHGWKLEDNSLVPHLMTKPPALSSILELTNCKCSK